MSEIRRTRYSGLRMRTQWWQVGKWRWRAGLTRGEWWIGARYDFAADIWVVGVFGLVVIFGRWWP